MKIVCVTKHFSSSVAELFSDFAEVEVMGNLRDMRQEPIDLLIFTGGDDINPERYGQQNKNSYYDDSRDKKEFAVFGEILKNRIPVNKVFGICRGLQLINVALVDGALIQDIQTVYGRNHPMTHKLQWLEDNPLDFLKQTNSLHHQAVKDVGFVRTPGKISKGKILAIEPETKLPEVISWGNKFLGVQFHPEFFPKSEIRDRFAKTIIEWVSGQFDMSTGSKKEQEKSIENAFREATKAVKNLGLVYENTPESTFWNPVSWSDDKKSEE